MPLSDAKLKEFIALYAEEFGKTISMDEAREMVSRLITLYELLLSPLPEEPRSPSD